MKIKGLHIGTKLAFGSWKLIWVTDKVTHCETISTKTAKRLIASGMSTEG